MPAILRTLGLLSLLLAICATVCHCQETAPQAADPAWKVPVANFDEAFAKAKVYFERPEHEAAEFYLRECLRYGIPKANHDVTDAMCRCMLAVVRCQEGYTFEATTWIMDVCDRYPDHLECLDIAADAAHRAWQARARKIQDPETKPWMVKCTSFKQAYDLAMKYRWGEKGEFFFRRCLQLGCPDADGEYWCRANVCNALCTPTCYAPERTAEAYAIALASCCLDKQPRALVFPIQALISYGDLDRAGKRLATMDRTVSLGKDHGDLEHAVDRANQGRPHHPHDPLQLRRTVR